MDEHRIEIANFKIGSRAEESSKIIEAIVTRIDKMEQIISDMEECPKPEEKKLHIHFKSLKREILYLRKLIR